MAKVNNETKQVETIEEVTTKNKNRQLFLFEDVEYGIIQNLTKSIIEYNNSDDLETPIELYINSRGGYVHLAFGLIDIIENSKVPVYVYCNGTASSAAFMILLSGHKRFITKRSYLMHHQMNGKIVGTTDDIMVAADNYKSMQKVVTDYILERTNFTKEKLHKIEKKNVNYWMNAKKALKYGVVDEII